MTEEKKKIRIKICGLSRAEDIAYVNEAMPDYCGFVINVPKSRRNTVPDQVRALVQKLSPAIIPVGVFRDEVIDTVEELLQDGTIRIAQLHGHEDESYIRELKSRGDYTVIRAFNETSFDQAGRSSADYVLLDHAAGGTGETFDWSLARKVKRPFFLAGGIGPENLEEALTCVQPWAVDLSSKVETDGRKDREKILAAVQAVRRWNGQ